MWTTIFLLICLVILIYLFLTWNNSHWKKLKVEGPKPIPLLGNFPNSLLQKKHMVYDVDDIYRQYRRNEDFVGVFSGRNPQLLILNPELCRRVYVTDFRHFHDNEASTMVDEKTDYIFANNPFALTGENWKERRALLTPGITIGRIKSVYPVTNKVCRNMSAYVRKQLKMGSKDGIDGKDLCLRFTSDMVTDCVLGLDAKSFDEKPTPILSMINKLFEGTVGLILYLAIVGIFPLLRKLVKGRVVPKDCEKFFLDLMENAINARKAQNEQRADFLHYMLQLQEKKNLTTLQLTANTMTFLLDGFETTATVLAHCMLLLARNPKQQETLRTEILQNLNSEGIVDFEKLLDLPYLDACIHESIRLFPPGFLSIKLCTEPIELTNKNGRTHKVKCGDIVVIPPYSIMTDEDYYHDPQSFIPERFLKDNCSVKDFRERGLYFGFGDGPRVCIGMRFALAQMKAVLVEILRNFTINVNPKTRSDNWFDPKYFIARLDGGIWLNFEERQ